MRESFRRYLRLLGFDQPPSGLSGLQQLTRAHLFHVPFENISKLLLFDREGAGCPFGLAEYLDGIEHHDLGGTCYSANPFFAELLRELGYDADLLSADMNTPHVHSCIRVRLDGRAYHVDVGNAAPFLEPFPIDALPHEFSRGEMKWIFDLAGDGRLRCLLFSRGEHVHGYVVNEGPRSLEDFRSIIVDSFQPGRTFMSLLRIVRIFPEHTVELLNRTVKVHCGPTTMQTTINSMEELRRVVDEQFLMPRCPVEKAVQILERTNRIEFFGAQQERSLYA